MLVFPGFSWALAHSFANSLANSAARSFFIRSRVTAGRDGRVMDGKSILGILLLSASAGTTIEVVAEGPDEEQALAALAALVESGFGEES